MIDDQPTPPRPSLQPLAFALLLTGAVFGFFIAVGSVVQLANLAVGVWFSEVLVFVGVPFVALQVLGRNPWRETALDSTTPKAIGLGFALGVSNYIAWSGPLMGVVQKLAPPRLLELFDGTQIFQHQSGPEMVALVAGLGIAAPFCEEFFFRGVLQRELSKRIEPPTAIVVTALIFSAFHLDPVGFLARFELGVVFGLLAWRSGSIWPGIAAHAANNLFATVLYFVGGEGGDDQVSWALLGSLWVGGNALFIAVIALARGRLTTPRPAADEPTQPVAVLKAVAPWLLAATFTLGGLVFFDWRGIQLKFYEQLHPLPPKDANDPALDALRSKVRRGDAELDEYLEARDQKTKGQTKE